MHNKIFIYAEHTAQSQANSGVQRVVRGLGRAFQEVVDEVVFVRWCVDSRALKRLDVQQLRHLEQWDGPVCDEGAAGVEPLHLDSRDKRDLEGAWLVIPEVTHLTFHEQPVTEDVLLYARRFRLKTAALAYDAIPLKRDEYAAIRETHSRYLQHLALSDVIVAISASVADDIRHFLRNTGKQADYMFPSIRHVLLPHELAKVERQAFAEPTSGEPLMVLCVGTVEPRKNQLALIEAFGRFKREYPDIACELKIVGNVHPLVQESLQQLSTGIPDVEVMHFVPDDRLVELYREAAFSVFPSVEEGYGLPIAESLWLGVPCLCAQHGSMAEIAAGGGAWCVDTRDPRTLYEGFKRMMLDAPLRRQLRQQAASRALLRWQDYARDLLGVLHGAPGITRAMMWVHSTVSYHGNSGVQRVVRQLAGTLERIGVDLSFVAWDVERSDFRPIDESEQQHLSLWNGPARFTPFSLAQDLTDAWLIVPELVLPNPNAQQVIQAARARGMRVAIVFYDLIPVTLTDLYSPEAQEGYHLFFKMITEADMLLPISETVGRDLWNYCRNRLDRLTTVKQRIHPLPLPGEMREFARNREVRTTNVDAKAVSILMVGTFEPRKNHLAAIFAVRAARQILRLRNIRVELVFAGSTKDHSVYAEDVLQEIAGDEGFRIVELPSDEALADLYRACDFTLFPSLLEGFGLPVLESLWHGRPCICSNTGAIAEVARGGGCVTVDPNNWEEFGAAIARLAGDPGSLTELSAQAVQRPLRSWDEYARGLTWLLRAEQPTFPAILERNFPVWRAGALRPGAGLRLSVCVSTYNRAEWLRHSLRQIIRSVELCASGVEILVVDNASSDHTPAVMQEFALCATLRYHRNEANVGMLGNLAVTSKLARGDYVWILGDDDLIQGGAVARILDVIRDFPRSEIIYLNYAYTHFDRPEELEDVEEIVAKATPIASGSISHFAEEVRYFAGYNENLFTAIYACVFRRDHAIAAYTQDTSGSPFSDLMTCIPTSVYVLEHMVNRPGYWIADPYVIVNMNVSWRRWVLIWHMERMPDLFDLAERQGVNKAMLAPYRRNHCADVVNWARAVYYGQDAALPEMFSMGRLIERCKHIPEFQAQVEALRKVYEVAFVQGRVVGDQESPWKLFSGYDLLNFGKEIG